MYLKLLLGWIVVILILTWTPGEALPKPDFLNISFIEFSAHFGMFLVFSFLLSEVIHHQEKFNLSKQKTYFIVLGMALILSLITEGGQLFIPGRSFHILDILTNLTGSVVGTFVFFQKIKYFSN